MAEKESESGAHQNSSGPGWVPQYPTVLYQPHDEILARITFHILYHVHCTLYVL